MKKSEVILLAVLATFSLVLLWNSLEMPYGTDQTFGPGFLPLNLSVAMLAVIGFMVLKTVVVTLRSKRNPSPHQATDGQEQATTTAAKTGVLVAAIALVVTTTAAMEFVGVLPAIAVMIALISWRFSDHPPLKSVIVSLFSVTAIYLIFEVWLNIPLTG